MHQLCIEMIKKAGHIVLIMILLVSTLGMTVDFHYCQNKLYDFSFIGKAHSCCLTDINNKPRQHDHCMIDEQSANNCKDKYIHVKAVDNYVTASFPVITNNLQATDLMISTFQVPGHLNFSESFARNDKTYDHSPPIFNNNLSFIQSYLL